MPRKDGIEALVEIKNSDRHKDIPVIIMSGSQAMEDVVAAYRTYANAYVPKANGFEDMIAFVSAVEKFWFLKAKLPQLPA
jgi:chemotaxis family two-component system response regulator Rcp1